VWSCLGYSGVVEGDGEWRPEAFLKRGEEESFDRDGSSGAAKGLGKRWIWS
jgi:hypothetical protein